LKGKVAIVTGATGALGRVVVKALLGSGAYVVSTCRSEDKQRESVEFLGDAGSLLTGVQTDVTDEVSVEALLQKVVEKYGRIEILLNIVGA
jgi:NAD(P)-dependent dehydrogenase (short-subunit alcohol dehydrogenase family)